MYLPKLRRINNALSEIKSLDPESDLSWKLIKRMINDSTLTALKLGNAWLINLDELCEIFTKGEAK